MKDILASPGRSLATGGVLTLVVAALVIAFARVDAGFFSVLLRWLHVVAGILWVGMVWFVNFIQFAALQEADEPGRATLMKVVVPRVAATFRHASHLALLTGALLLMSVGYLLDGVVFSAPVYIPPERQVLLWGGVLGGVAMWALVQFMIWPNLKLVLGQTPADAAARAHARDQVRLYARLNLVLSVPVTFAMVAAAHLY